MYVSRDRIAEGGRDGDIRARERVFRSAGLNLSTRIAWFCPTDRIPFRCTRDRAKHSPTGHPASARSSDYWAQVHTSVVALFPAVRSSFSPRSCFSVSLALVDSSHRKCPAILLCIIGRYLSRDKEFITVIVRSIPLDQTVRDNTNTFLYYYFILFSLKTHTNKR